jgi:hypothetical protein
MQIQSITGWQDHIQAGREYLKTAGNAVCRPTVFNNELIFQLAAMGIEKTIAGLCQFHHQMPYDHTLSGLVVGLADVCPVEPELVEKIKRIEQIDDMCSLTAQRREPPNDAEIREILAVGEAVARFARESVSDAVRQTTAA